MRRTAIAAVLLLSGCATQPDYWEPTQEKDWTWKDTKVVVLDQNPYANSANGWVHRNPKTGLCTVFILRRADYQCVLAHELKHCAGWDHPKYPTNLGCYHMPILTGSK
jgi:hypothetical protein